MKDTRDMMVKDYDTCTDEELIARLRAGEREITDYLIDKYKSLVRTRARAHIPLKHVRKNGKDMKYCIETTDKGCIETLEISDKEKFQMESIKIKQ